jgi:N-methylhydantoinase B/oxoprolinase/acetone carboxylase alpha subunit
MPDDGEIQLTVPADTDMSAVVVAAVAAVVRSAGVPADGIARARAHAAEGFLAVLARGTGDVVTLTARAERHDYWFELERGTGNGTYTAHERFGS